MREPVANMMNATNACTNSRSFGGTVRRSSIKLTSARRKMAESIPAVCAVHGAINV